jgi:phosphate transport system protein
MLHDTLDAFARLDVAQALKVMQSDREVDLEYKTATRALMTYMMEDPRYIARVLNVMWVLRSLERIGDHARNVAEQLVYLVQGTDIRHISDEALKQRIDGQV